MKSIILLFSISLLYTSCAKSEVCECVETSLSMMKEEIEAGNDLEKLTSIHEKYSPEMERCERLEEGRSEKERKAMEVELKECDAFKEMESLSNEMLNK